ncbi:Sec-independent protein translocase protein TatA [Caulobacter ginsengisoli]|uniref:Sec-independent protein translocase protein TatA n=1 Tax=Caulobacter ginsengisoli TaxID=400775 RepID=A0ABU0IQV8_9CAUL|nr:hypothetical protein [Caulobacter ginsengisoli]MDQ0464393.1 Sec-independent protein translocase protein TatA [Caulobacter ginsengisoli]
MNITSPPANAGGSAYDQRMQLRAALQQAAEARKSEIATDKAKAMNSPIFKAADSKKAQAKARVQQIVEWLKIVKKLYANDPKAMAKALAQVFKDLKSAVKAYRDAGGQEMSASGEAAGAAMASAPAPDGAKADDKADDADGEARTAETTADEPGAEPAQAAVSEDPSEAARPSSDGASLYQAVVGEIRKAVGEDGLDFLKQVRSVTNEIVKLVDTARGQAAIRKRDKETDKAFEDLDKSLKSLREEMDGMEQDIRREAPTAGMKLDIAA